MKTVFDKDRFLGDDKMCDWEIDISPFLEASDGVRFQETLLMVRPSRGSAGRTNCLTEESSITWRNGKVKQDMILRLKNMECGEMEIML